MLGAYYDILGVADDATTAQIKTAYRQKARVAHPDRGGDPDHFRVIQTAYETLSDPEMRATYDASLNSESVGAESAAAGAWGAGEAAPTEQVDDLDYTVLDHPSPTPWTWRDVLVRVPGMRHWVVLSLALIAVMALWTMYATVRVDPNPRLDEPSNAYWTGAVGFYVGVLTLLRVLTGFGRRMTWGLQLMCLIVGLIYAVREPTAEFRYGVIISTVGVFIAGEVSAATWARLHLPRRARRFQKLLDMDGKQGTLCQILAAARVSGQVPCRLQIAYSGEVIDGAVRGRALIADYWIIVNEREAVVSYASDESRRAWEALYGTWRVDVSSHI